MKHANKCICNSIIKLLYRFDIFRSKNFDLKEKSRLENFDSKYLENYLQLM